MQRQHDSSDKPLGNIDGLFHHGITGWYYDKSGNSKTIQIRHNGTIITSTDADESRPDVQAFLGFGKNSGFTLGLDSLEQLGAVGDVITLSICDSTGLFNFNGRELRYCVGTVKWFNSIRAIFDADFYRSRYDLCHLSKDSAFQHFVCTGMFNQMDPCPWFSAKFYTENYGECQFKDKVALICYLENELTLKEKPALNFDPAFYLEKYPDLQGVPSLLVHYIQAGRFEGRTTNDQILPDAIEDEFNEMLELEPALSTARTGLKNIIRYPFYNDTIFLPKLLHQRVGDDIKVVVCVPFISRGGADLISTFLFRAYQQAYGKEHVLMLVTDKCSIDVPEWIDEGSQVICIDDEADFRDDEDKLLAFHNFIGKLAPEKILNVNSHLTWRLFERHGVQLSSAADLYAFLFCFDYNKYRDKVGYIVDFLPKTLKCLKKVYYDNKRIIKDINQIYGFSNECREKMHTVYVPAAEGILPTDYSQIDRRDTVLWVGRLALQKRPDILVEIAKLLPGQKFDVYGPPGNSIYSDAIVNGEIPNINYCGVYNSLDEIDYTKYTSYLNTSEWDGLPTIIIQMMAIGLPIVTSTICGIPELINEKNSWPVYDFNDSAEYARALREVGIKAEKTKSKVKAARDDVLRVHQWESFFERLSSLDAFSNFSDDTRITTAFSDRRRTA